MGSKFKTIVGGRSKASYLNTPFSKGIEILLKKGKVDNIFKDLLIKDPLLAASSIELKLTENEEKVIKSIPKSILRNIINNIFVEKQHRKTFLKKNAAVIFALLISTGTINTLIADNDEVLLPPDDVIKEVNIEKMDLIIHNKAAIPFDDFEIEAIEVPIEKIDINIINMNNIQFALEEYKKDNETYPSTELWESEINPILEYIQTHYLYDPWGRKYHYEAVIENGIIINYLLESYGADLENPDDNIPCAINPELHSFENKEIE